MIEGFLPEVEEKRSFSDFHTLNTFNNKGVENNAVKVSLAKIGKEVDLVATRGLFTYEDRVFWEVGEGISLQREFLLGSG